MVLLGRIVPVLVGAAVQDQPYGVFQVVAAAHEIHRQPVEKFRIRGRPVVAEIIDGLEQAEAQVAGATAGSQLPSRTADLPDR